MAIYTRTVYHAAVAADGDDDDDDACVLQGGGCGAQLASWIQHGRPQMDMFSYDIRSVHPVYLGPSVDREIRSN